MNFLHFSFTSESVWVGCCYDALHFRSCNNVIQQDFSLFVSIELPHGQIASSGRTKLFLAEAKMLWSSAPMTSVWCWGVEVSVQCPDLTGAEWRGLLIKTLSPSSIISTQWTVNQQQIPSDGPLHQPWAFHSITSIFRGSCGYKYEYAGLTITIGPMVALQWDTAR